MELNKKELRIICYEFRVKAKTLLNTSFQDFNSNLKRFMNYISETTLINDYVMSNVIEEIDMAKEFKEINEGYGRLIFDLGITEQEEVSNIYQILRYIDDNNYNITQSWFLSGYCSSKKHQDRIDEFNSRVVDIFVTHIETYLRKIGIQMGLDEEAKYMIIDNKGNIQINDAKDNAVINAEQEMIINYNTLSKLTSKVEEFMDENIEDIVREELKETIDCIKELATSKNASPSMLKMCKTTLTNLLPKVAGAINLSAAIISIIDFISKCC